MRISDWSSDVCSSDLQFGWLPASGRGQTVEVLDLHLSIFTADGWRHIILPAITLGLSKCALIIRLARATTREVMLMDYVKFARAKGLRAKRVIGVHILKNIMDTGRSSCRERVCQYVDRLGVPVSLKKKHIQYI